MSTYELNIGNIQQIKKSNKTDGYPALYYLKVEALERICSKIYYSGDFKEHGKHWKGSQSIISLEQKRINLKNSPIIQAMDIYKKYNLFIGATYKDEEFEYVSKVFCSCANYTFVHRPKNNEYDNKTIHHCKHIKKLAFFYLQTYHQCF